VKPFVFVLLKFGCFIKNEIFNGIWIMDSLSQILHFLILIISVLLELKFT